MSFTILYLRSGLRKMISLTEVMDFNKPAGANEAVPIVSIVVPARNEEEKIELALLSLVGLDYPALEIIVVNDRSTDATGDLIEGFARKYPYLHFLHIEELPGGWLGKCNALSVGASMARGEFLLFTDADVIMEKTVVSRSVTYMQRERIDHLSLIFNNSSRGFLLNGFIVDAVAGLFAIFRPWAVANKKSAAFMGVGAFNMVRKTAYEAIGGFDQIRMHPIDDIMLGKIIKRRGFSQACLLGWDFVQVPWYSSFREMVVGLEKNVFAVVHYRFVLVLPFLAGVFLVSILPFWGTLLATGMVQLLCFLTTALRGLMFYHALRKQGLPLAYLPAVFVSPYLICYVYLRSALLFFKRGGIDWRGHHYDREELKKSEAILL